MCVYRPPGVSTKSHKSSSIGITIGAVAGGCGVVLLLLVEFNIAVAGDWRNEIGTEEME